MGQAEQETTRLLDKLKQIDGQRMQAKQDALLKGLKWYADNEKWEKHYGNIAAVDFDKGERARSVLAKYEGEQGSS